MNLIIVESYSKIKSIKKFLGEDYDVIASGGHIRELSSFGYGYDRETMKPIWRSLPSKGKKTTTSITKSIKLEAKKADIIYLATDPDREGEAISWHIYDILDEKNKAKCKRITFNEITKKAIVEAINHPREIDINLVHSQWTRRILDRMVGFDLSGLVRSKLNAISAGRVQSVALLFIVERAIEIENFISESWWLIQAKFKEKFETTLIEPKGTFDEFRIKLKNEFRFSNEVDAKKIFKELSNDFLVTKVKEPKINNGKKLMPFQTDTLLSTAYNELGWSTTKTNIVAQELYSGIDIDGETIAFISYPRTDINRLNDDFINLVKEFISTEFGANYLEEHVKKVVSGPLVQGAHEGIRPIDIKFTPEELYKKIKGVKLQDHYKLYNLIWNRTIAAFTKTPTYKHFEIILENNGNLFVSDYTQTDFPGYNILPFYRKKEKNQKDYSFLKEQAIFKAELCEIVPKQTKPPAFYNEGSLVKELKSTGVGRPSTYSSMVNVVRSRGYVETGKELIPTKMGLLVCENLRKDLSKYISKEFTAEMETDLDEISNGEIIWNDWLLAFKKNFDIAFAIAKEKMIKIPKELVGRKCPDCEDGDLIYNYNKRNHSKFIGCSNFKNGCKHAESLADDTKPKPVILDELCPKCSKNLIKRVNYRKQEFIACTGFPKCRFIRNINPKKEEK